MEMPGFVKIDLVWVAGVERSEYPAEAIWSMQHGRTMSKN